MSDKEERRKSKKSRHDKDRRRHRDRRDRDSPERNNKLLIREAFDDDDQYVDEELLYDKEAEITFENDQSIEVEKQQEDSGLAKEQEDTRVQIASIARKELKSTLSEIVQESVQDACVSLQKQFDEFKKSHSKKRVHDVSTSGEDEDEFSTAERQKHKKKRNKHYSSQSSSDSDSDSDDSMFIEDDKAKGHSISEEAKRFIQKRYKKKVVKEKFLPLLNKYKTPKNAPFLRSQQTNKEIWHKLYPRVKTRDNSLSLIQRNLAKSSIAIIRALDNTERKSICLEDAITILGQTHQQVATLRREMHKQSVPFSFRQAMEKSEEDDELLYGEKFQKRLREAREACKEDRRPFLGRNPHTSRYQNQKRRPFKQHHQNQGNHQSHQPQKKFNFQQRRK